MSKTYNLKRSNLLILPFIVTLTVLTLIPFVILIYLSLTSGDFSLKARQFVFLSNYIKIFNSERFWKTTLTTLYWISGAIILEFPLGLIIALALKRADRRGLKGKNLLNTIFLIPLAIAPVVVGVMWRFMFNSSFGIINYLLKLIGVNGIDWLGGKMALFSVILVDVWEFTPLFILILYAGLQTIPEQMYEAASVDGAGYLQSLWYLTLPTIKPVATVVIVIRLIDLMRWIVTIFIMTGGGPGTKTEILNVYLYYLSFWQFDIDKSSALAIILIIISAIYALIFARLSAKRTNIISG